MFDKSIWILMLLHHRINLFAEMGTQKAKLSRRLNKIEWNWIKKVDYDLYKYLKS